MEKFTGAESFASSWMVAWKIRGLNGDITFKKLAIAMSELTSNPTPKNNIKVLKSGYAVRVVAVIVILNILARVLPLGMEFASYSV